MKYRLVIFLLILGGILLSGCSEKKTTTTPEEPAAQYKELIAYRTYIDRIEQDGRRTMVIIVSSSATRTQVKDLVDFLVNDIKETKIWLEVWDDLETLQKGSAITDADKIAHYIMYAEVDKSTGKKGYYWERTYS
ncbi:MAG: hypothetical protein KO464_09880 [Candidatus Methanofastidiosum sp.]|nr:hypothetical protein [Methanofastidiosum sp.]